MCSENNDKSSRPVTPLNEDCCHSGCNPCIFDVHKKLLEEYEKRRKQNTKVQTNENLLCPYSYTKFVVTNIKEISEDYIVLVLKPQKNDLRSNKKILIDPGQHVMLHLWDTTKSYTPISFTDDSIEFLIRLYSNGKFSNYLKNIKINDEISVRGPYGDFQYKFNSFQEVVMFSMGSGITVVYSVAKSIIDNELEETKVHLIGGFKKISQIPLKNELRLLSDYWNFKCTLYISQLHSDTFNLHGVNVKFGRLSKESVLEILGDCPKDTTLILICGNHEFNDSIRQWALCTNYTHVHMFE